MEEIPVIWSKLESNDRAPTKRSGHSLTVLGTSAYLFGGIDLRSPPGPNSDLYMVDLVPKDLVWNRVDSSSATAPPPRWRHSATAISKTQLLVFGGFATSTSRLNDLWVFDSTSRAWVQPLVPTTSPDAAAAAAFQARKRKAGSRRDGTDTSRAGAASAMGGAAAAAGGGPSEMLGEFGAGAWDDPTLMADTNPDAPTPRGAHSAVLIGEHLYVFGGYGGIGYQRRDFNDLHRLHIPTMTWIHTDPASITGAAPEPRSGHIAAARESLMLVFGGWNSTTQFNDLHIFDTETSTWTSVAEAKVGPYRWNHAGLCVAAVPHWQMFVFGGSGAASPETGDEYKANKDKGSFLSDVLVLDTGSMRWTDLTPTAISKGTAPHSRADASLVYDSTNKRVIMFGGWANRWFNDAWSLPVASIIGPPYAVLGVQPVIGPITGGQKLIVSGQGFEAGATVNVRFISGKKFADASGTALSATEIEVLTPSFEAYGPGNVDVRVALRGQPLTITTKPYTFFNVTDAKHSFAFGPGLLQHMAPGTPAVFYVCARDTANADRTTGGDEFTVRVVQLQADGTEGKTPTVVEGVSVHDEDNGRYLVTYVPPAPGGYHIYVDFNGTYGGPAGPVRGSPFKAAAAEGAPKDNNRFAGNSVWEHARELIETATATAKTTLDGILREVPADSLDTLLNVKNNLSNVSGKESEVRLKFDVSQAVLAQLKREGARKDKELMSAQVKLDKGVSTWEDARKHAPVTKAAIAPLVKLQSAQTRKDIEAFEATTAEFVKRVDENAYWRFETGYEASMTALAQHEERYNAHMKRVERMQHLADTFEFPTLMNETNKMMRSVAEDTEQMRALWAVAKEAREYFATSREQLWSEVKPEALEDYAKTLQKKFKAGGTKRTRACAAYKGLDKQIRDFLSTCPLIASLRHKSMRPRHWTLLMNATKKTFTPPHEDESMKLQNLLELNLHEFTADVEDICDQATKEEKMEDTLRKLGETWSGVVWIAESYKEGSPVRLLKLSEDDFETLETDQLAVQGMMSSRYLATFETEVLAWQRALSMVAEVLLQLADIQRKWSYLEPLFIGSEEVRRELPEDAVRFEAIDRDVKQILAEADSTRNVKEACNKDGLFAELERLQAELDRCEKSLADFLNGKRTQFPRFFFVSKNDLLDILSNGSNPHRIIQHVTKVFLSTDTFVLEDRGAHGDRPSAVRWVSAVGQESVDFNPPVRLDGKVEIYMQTALDAQRDTLRAALAASIKRRPTQSRIDWLMNKLADGRPSDPAQLILLVSGMDYVRGVEEAFDRIARGQGDAMHKHLEHAQAELSDLIRLTQTNLNKGDRQRVMCMITLDAHGRDIIQKLILENVREKTEFQWQTQLKQRYVDGRAVLHIADAVFDYKFEYLGNGPRLVVTPLTDRIYVTATQALNLKMGCAPAGPAGTGKTETTKDLANALAICCYVFNCAPEMDYQSLAGIFKGLAASGSWGCFDEFNRLIPEVLSVCAVQFKSVCDGIRAQRNSVVIEGDEVHLDWSAGAFITMNPGYLGRSELPEGLKSLFRPITVMVPDLVLICENMLMAEGFVEARVLASKFYSLYALLRELLSKQAHYDWGLRAIKSVLVVAGGFKRAEPDLPEQTLLMRALRDFNTPKIVKQDEVIFFGLLGDLFPGIDPPRKQDQSLEAAVHAACIKRGLDPDELFRLKVVQLEELLAIRHCVFVMGPPGCGKSNCWQTLQAARADMKRKTKAVDLDPKAVSTEELYGYVHPATREWKDGLLSKIMRDLATEPNDDAKWILLDGDLDAVWVESMNSVMDDNKMLTLASNERIPLKGHMRMIFEIRDLNFASPATVSRAGIIYISTNTGSQWRSLIASWIKKLDGSDAVKAVLRTLFDRYCAATLLFLKKECKPMVPTEDVTLITNLLRLLNLLLSPAVMKHVNSPNTPADEVTRILDTYMVFAAIWAFGSALSVKDGEDYRVRFSDYWRGEFKSVRMPSRETLFDYWLSPETLQFEPWKNSPHFSVVTYDSRTTPMSQVTVPTPETCSVTYWMEQLLHARDPIMLVGYAGCGKTQLVNGLLAKQKPEERVSHTINFNFYTDSKALQVIMEAPLEKKTGTNFGPPGKASLVYFLDDLNLPEMDKYDTQSAIALVRQHFDYGHWYERAKLQLRNILNAQYIACMNPTAGSFLVNPRLQRHFVTFAIGFPGPTSLHTIYSTFLEGHLRAFSEEVQGLGANLLSAALQLHSAVASTFRKSAACFHYEFNVRHLSNVFQGLLMAQPSEFRDATKFAMLWLHESERTYGDRLVSGDDLAKYKALAAAQAKKKFPGINLGSFFGDNADPLVFSHFAESTQEKVYDRVTSMERVRGILEESLREYNENFAAMNLVLFDDAIRHVCRIARIILNPSGHALLVGVGGSGKQSLSRLAAFICGYRVYQITISGTYGIADLKDDLKAMYNIAMKDEGVMFLFTDSQITNERFLVFINDLLASGDIPDLYTPEEVDGIVNAMVPKVKSAGGTPDRKSCWAYFLNMVRRNLHVVLCFSPVGDDFRTRAKKFPALSNCTVIDWFQPWPKEALFSVGQKFLREIDLGSDAVREGVEKFMPFSFDSVNRAAARFLSTDRRYVYTTPKSYLELLKLYKQLLSTKRKESAAAIDRLSNGLRKLRDTAAAVAKIEEDLKVKLVAAEEKRAVSEGIAAEVAANKAIVEAETAKANVLATECAAIASRASEIRQDAERDLEAAIPAVQRAMEALNTLDKKDLGECLAEDMQVLTNRGWLGLDDLLSRADDGGLRFAGYDPATTQLVYEEAQKFILKPCETREMVEIEQAGATRHWGSEGDEPGNFNPRRSPDCKSDGVSLLVTPGHDLYLRYGLFEDARNSVVWSKKSRHFAKREAREVVGGDARAAFTFLSTAEGGVAHDGSLPPFMETMNLTSDAQVAAFLQLYGYWLGDGDLQFDASDNIAAVVFSGLTSNDAVWVRGLLATLGLRERPDEAHGAAPGAWDFDVTESTAGEVSNHGTVYDIKLVQEAYFTVFQEYAHQSAKWIAEWVWGLGAEHALLILRGLAMADGSEVGGVDCIQTTSPRFRDDLMRLALHAGRGTSARVLHRPGQMTSEGAAACHSVRCNGVEKHPLFSNHRDVRVVQYTGRVWCVTLPHGFLVARRVAKEDGVVTSTSSPVIIGNCKTMTTPPKGVDDVFAAVAVLLAAVHKGVVCDKKGKVKDKDKTWEAAKKALLTDVKGFMDQLMSFKDVVDGGGVPESNANFKDVRPYLELAHFNPDGIRTKNSAAAGLCAWVINIVAYHDIVVTVEPKKIKLREANEELASANARLEEVRAQVATLQAQLDELSKKLAEANAEKAAAIAEVESGQSKLELANRLTNALADENVRWAEGITQLEADRELLVGDVLLAAAFISYVGPFTKKYRDSLIKDTWVTFMETAANGARIPMSAKPDPRAILTNDAQIAVWNSEGLPDDTVSVENGCIVTATERWPLLIDPQLQGIAWVREKEKAAGLVVVRLDQRDMQRKLEMALERGTPVLIENMGERIDAVLSPIISRQLIKKGRNQFLKLGDKEVEFNPKFRLYLHTKLSNPHFPPELQAECCLVNFTVTEVGLEEQLLALVVQKERPDLAEQKTELIKQQNAFKIKIKELEDGILKRLAEAEGDITEDRELIEGLENTKRIANDIAEKSAIARRTTMEISVTSEKYRSVAHRATLLYFLMMDLFRMHSYYIYSLSAFVTIFERSIDLVSQRAVAGAQDAERELDENEESMGMQETKEKEAADVDAEAVPNAEDAAASDAVGAAVAADESAPATPSPRTSSAKAPARILTDAELVERCASLTESATSVAFQYVNRGLFERDRLTVAAQLCFRILVDAGELPDNLVRMLMLGPTFTGDAGSSGAVGEWLPEALWPRVKALETVKPVFEKLGDDMQAESSRWRAWFDDEKPEAAPLPGDYKSNVSSFHLLLLLRALRPDRLAAALNSFVAEKLGQSYVLQKPFDMVATYAESAVSTPIFFVLFPGVDPTVWVEALGREKGLTTENGKFKNLSMGQGQEAPAMAALQRYAKEGGWIMLQNVHLMQSWLPTLERQLEIVANDAHPDFRCFISAEPPPVAHMKNMPESLMQGCIKVANEAPADLLSNLTRAWANFSQERVEASQRPNEFKACLFTLCWYHAILLGRRRFGQQGWSRKYSFNTGDLLVSASILDNYINRVAQRSGGSGADAVPWADLRYLWSEIVYSGHITDAFDRRTNNTYLAVYMRPEILNGMALAPGFKVPDVSKMNYDDLAGYISTSLPKEGPPMFGLHPNAEIGYLTSFADDIFSNLVSLSGGGSGGGASSSAQGAAVRNTLNTLLEQLPENFQLIDIEMRAQPLLNHKSAPFVLVAMQECSRMNELLDEIRRSLIELRKGLDGQLNTTEAMEDLAAALSINQVPGRNIFHRCSWERFAWPSRRGLLSWFADLQRRVEQLSRWSSTLVTPVSLWLPGLFNPMAFLTAVMQVTARSTGLPLDNLAIETHVTTMLSAEEVTAYPEDGMYIHGLFMEGARWATGDDAGEPYTVAGVQCAGHIVDSKLKQLLPPMPVMYARAVPVQPTWIPSNVGYLRQDPSIYECPVYSTTFRGPTYVFLSTLKTQEPTHKWILAGCALVMQEDT